MLIPLFSEGKKRTPFGEEAAAVDSGAVPSRRTRCYARRPHTGAGQLCALLSAWEASGLPRSGCCPHRCIFRPVAGISGQPKGTPVRPC